MNKLNSTSLLTAIFNSFVIFQKKLQTVNLQFIKVNNRRSSLVDHVLASLKLAAFVFVNKRKVILNIYTDKYSTLKTYTFVEHLVMMITFIKVVYFRGLFRN